MATLIRAVLLLVIAGVLFPGTPFALDVSDGATVQALPNDQILQNVKTLAVIAAGMYPTVYGFNLSDPVGQFSNCSRAHRAATSGDQGTFEQGIVGTAEDALGAAPGNLDVWFFDSDTTDQQSFLGFRSQFCHAILIYFPAGQAPNASMSIADPNAPVAIISFRGSSDLGAAFTDLNFFPAKKVFFRSRLVEVHPGFHNSLFVGQPRTCSPRLPVNRRVPSCSQSILTKLEEYLTAVQPTTQVFVTGHSLGAASAALLALFLDQQANPLVATRNYEVQGVYTYGQPKIGIGRAWRNTYNGTNNLSSKTYRSVHNADPVAMLASGCQYPKIPASRQYKHVGTMIRIRTPNNCTTNGPLSPPFEGECYLEDIPAGPTDPYCTIASPTLARDDCSIYLGRRVVGGGSSFDKCYCGVLPYGLVLPLGPDHSANRYRDNSAGCTTLVDEVAGGLPAASACGSPVLSPCTTL